MRVVSGWVLLLDILVDGQQLVIYMIERSEIGVCGAWYCVLVFWGWLCSGVCAAKCGDKKRVWVSKRSIFTWRCA